MQRTGRQEMALRLRDEGPSAAAGYAVRLERSANQWPVFALNPAMAGKEAARAMQIRKDGRPLAGAASNSYMTNSKDTCEPKAIDKSGKPIAGAAKASFLKKCEAKGISDIASGERRRHEL
jgi:hypothetical protein